MNLKNLIIAIIFVLGVVRGEEFTIGSYFRDLYRQCGQLRWKWKMECPAVAQRVEAGYLNDLRESGVEDPNMVRMAKVVREVCYYGCLERGRDGKKIIQKGVAEAKSILFKR
jgi:hypothetical protein